MLEVSERAGRLEIVSPMRFGVRLVVALVGLVPLLAPYELLLRPQWPPFVNPLFAFAALISVVAVALSGFCFLTALAGLGSRMILDSAAGTFTHSAAAPLVRKRTAVYSLGAITQVEVRTREWSDSGPSFWAAITTADGKVFATASVDSREEVERLVDRIKALPPSGTDHRGDPNSCTGTSCAV